MWTRPMTTEEQRQWRVRCEDAMNCMCVVARLFKCLPQSGLAAVWEINPEVPWNLVKLGENNLSTVPWRPCWDGVATMDTSTTSSIWGWDGKLNPLLFSIGIATYNLGSPLASSQLYIGEQWSVDERNVATYKCGVLRPCVPTIHVAAKWKHAFNQDRFLVQSPLQKMSGQGVRTHPLMVLSTMSREIK